MRQNLRYALGSAAASGWAGWALAHLEFGSSVNSITTRGADYAHHITANPPGFEIPAASLQVYIELKTKSLLTTPGNVLPLHLVFSYQPKVQMLTTSSRILTRFNQGLFKSLGLYLYE